MEATSHIIQDYGDPPRPARLSAHVLAKLFEQVEHDNPSDGALYIHAVLDIPTDHPDRAGNYTTVAEVTYNAHGHRAIYGYAETLGQWHCFLN